MTNWTPVPVYVFRDPRFSSAGDTVISAAPLEAVVAIYGGGGLNQTEGLSAAFGGCAVYRQRQLGKEHYHLAVWGKRKASKFCQSFRNAGIKVEVIKSPPPGRLILWLTK
jgi:hypothetical protein